MTTRPERKEQGGSGFGDLGVRGQRTGQRGKDMCRMQMADSEICTANEGGGPASASARYRWTSSAGCGMYSEKRMEYIDQSDF